MTWTSNRQVKKGPDITPLKSENLVRTSSEKPKTLRDYEIIVRRDVFDTLKKAPAEKEKPPEVTELNLSLKGTVVGDGRNSAAVILDGSTRKEDLYRINEEIQGARIEKILSDQVILNVDGRREVLMIEEKSSASPPARPGGHIRRPGPSIKQPPIKRRKGKI